MMHQSFAALGFMLLVLMVPLIYRIIVGPTSIDRMIALNVIGTKTTILLIIIGILSHSVEMFVDLALTYALLNFIGSLACARFVQRKRPPRPDGKLGAEFIQGEVS